MNPTAPQNQSGFTYISVLILVAVMGISLTGTSAYWSTTMKRERENELLFRGEQYQKAIESYCRFSNNRAQPDYPKQLQDLRKDPRSLVVRRHIRKLYADPVNGGENWALILDAKGGIKGVASKSEAVPLKKGGFPSRYKAFEKAKTYRDWKFVYTPEKEEKG